jgi:hypothetical protein
MKNLFFIIILIFFSALIGCKSIQTINKSAEYSDNDENYTIWISHISGIQCRITYFTDIETAVNFLKKNGIAVLNSRELHFFTCCACGCPSNLHFAVKIRTIDFGKALSLGWSITNDNRLID